jgi:hypothetical protein
MLNKLILPLQILITGIAFILSILVKSMLWIHKPAKMFGMWFKIRVLWKLNTIHVKLKKEK